MPRGPVPEHVDAFLRSARPAIIGRLLADGSPSTVATWYLWLGDGRVMLSHQEGGFRARNLARDGRVALTVLGEDWYDHVSLRGRVVEVHADPDWVDLDTICRHYRGIDYPRDAGYSPSTVIFEVDTWHEFRFHNPVVAAIHPNESDRRGHEADPCRPRDATEPRRPAPPSRSRDDDLDAVTLPQ